MEEHEFPGSNDASPHSNFGSGELAIAASMRTTAGKAAFMGIYAWLPVNLGNLAAALLLFAPIPTPRTTAMLAPLLAVAAAAHAAVAAPSTAVDPCTKIAGVKWVVPADVRACFECV